MSFTSSHSTESGRLPKRRIQRRHGACEPCRSSKTKCDGRMPCGACRSERRRQCPCTYSEKVMKLQQVTAEMRRRAEQDRAEPGLTMKRSPSTAINEHKMGMPSTGVLVSDQSRPSSLYASHEHNSPANKDDTFDLETNSPFLPLSLCGTVEEFKKLKITRGSAAPVVVRCDGFEAIDTSTSAPFSSSGPDQTADRRPQIPELTTSIDEISSMKDRLDAIWASVTQGRLRRAWVELASLVREAELLDTSDALQGIQRQDLKSWKQIWTNILDLESQLGLALGRPTCLVLSGQSRCRQETQTSGQDESDLDATRLDLYKHIQCALSIDSGSPTVSSDFHDRARSILSRESFHKVGLCTTESSSASARDLQMNTHLFFMVIYCRLASMCDVHTREGKTPLFLGTETTDTARSLNLNQPRQKLTYCRMMFRSAKFVVNIFLNFLSDDPDIVGQNWMRCHSAFIAATLLGIAKLRHEVEWNTTTELLRKLEQAFSKLSRTSPDCKLFKTAIRRLQDLNSVKEPASEVTRNKHSGIKHRKPHITSSTETSPSHYNVREASSLTVAQSNVASPVQTLKRNRDQMEAATQLSQSLITSFGSNMTDEDTDSPLQMSSNSFEGSMDRMGYYQDNSGLFSQSSSFLSNTATSTATSFCETDAGLATMPELTMAHPGPPFAYPFPYNIVHPPMMLYNSAILTGDPVLLQTPVGMQYFQAAPNIAPTSASISQISATNQSQELDPDNIHEMNTITSTAPIHGFKNQTHGGSSVINHKSSNLSGSSTATAIATPDQARRPGMERRHSAEALYTGSNIASTTVPNTWRVHPSPSSTAMQQSMLHANNADTTERSQMTSNDVSAGAFYLPTTRSVHIDPAGIPQNMYQHAQLPTCGSSSPFFPTDIPSAPDEGQESSPFRQECSFSCNQQHYVQGQDQWRQMSVNAGVPGGP